MEGTSAISGTFLSPSKVTSKTLPCYNTGPSLLKVLLFPPVLAWKQLSGDNCKCAWGERGKALIIFISLPQQKLKFYGKYVILNAFIYVSFKSKQFLTGMFLLAGTLKNSCWVIAGLAGGERLSPCPFPLSFLSFTDRNHFILSFIFSHFNVI